jgi:threonine/homoserine/homoserine lactone efflux protein
MSSPALIPHIAVFITDNRAIAGFIKHRPTWAAWQRRITGTLLGTVAVLLLREVPARARV